MFRPLWVVFSSCVVVYVCMLVGVASLSVLCASCGPFTLTVLTSVYL